MVVFCLSSLALSAPAGAWAGVTGSLHDFPLITPTPPGGKCTACHLPHAGQPAALWSRSLSQEESFYDQATNPNYRPGTTLLCYDCHDDGASADAEPSGWSVSHEPQDVARTGGLVGYYENACGQLPGAGAIPAAGAPTGGHYWKSEPSGTPDYAKGDKIPCSLCHDPHNAATGTNEVFFRTTAWDGSQMTNLDINGYGTDLNASTYNATTLPNGSRTGTGTGRDMCASCHGYADHGNQVTLYSITVPKPTVGVPEHDRNEPGATPCIKCHGHNQIAGCNSCHGYPPLNASPFDRDTNPDGQSYAGGAGAHQRHLDALGAAIFNCAICHGPDPGQPTTTWHNQSGAQCSVPAAGDVDIMGQTAYWGAGSSYNGVTAGGFTTPGGVDYAFAAKGGGDQRCANLACHGYPPNTAGALNWGDDMVDDVTGDAVSIEVCKWCHDSTPARIGAGPVAPNVLGNNNGGASATGDWSTGTWGADVSGHGKASGNYDADSVGDGGAPDSTPTPAANKGCTLCHDATYTAGAPTKAHFNGLDAENRLRATINGIAAPDENATCVNCHQNTAGGDSASAVSQVSTHGNDFDGAEELPRASFTRQCRQCHNVHGANWNGTGRNLHMIGTWVDTSNDGLGQAGEEARVDTTGDGFILAGDLRVIFTANSGAGSYDAGNNEGYNPPRSVCVVCHVSLVGNHSQVGDSVARGSGHNPVGGDCMQCHDHDFDNVPATPDAFAPSGCTGCHGTTLTEGTPGSSPGQFWPDGSAVFPQYDYADNQTGAHLKHVEAISTQVFGETAAQVVTDTAAGNAFEKQKVVCSFCHPNPGGPNHFNNDSAAPSGLNRVDVLRGGSAGNYFQKYTTGSHPTYNRTNFADDVTALDSTYSYAALTCSNLVCHNQAATPASWNTPPAWNPAVATCSDVSCHAAATYTIAHATHVNGAPKSYACTECHADNFTAGPANLIPLAHGNGEVDMKWDNVGSIEAAHGGNGFYDKDNTGGAVPSAGDTAFEYKSGGATATHVSYARSCYRVYCHGGDNNATYTPDWGGTGNTPNTRSPVWNWDAGGTASLACTTCHATAPPTGRHLAHDANDAWVPNECGSCHEANNNKTSMTGREGTHVNGNVEFDLAVTYVDATGDCTNVCHDVGAATMPESADPGDWLDTNELACTDCHSGTYIGTAPTSGLHQTATAMAHDERFLANESQAPAQNATCTNCHRTTGDPAGPSASHLTGPAAATPENSTVTTFNWNNEDLLVQPWKLIAYDNSGYAGGSTSCQATCHSDYKLADTGGLWRRAWVGVVDARPAATDVPGAPVCGNCHGDFTGWNLPAANASTTNHTNPYNQGGANPDQMQVPHSQCQTCHGWGHANYTEAWAGTPPAHGDGSITMNGPTPATGAEYDDATGGCTAACHAASYVLNTTSGWGVNYGNFGSGACEGCHNGVQTQYPLAPNVMGDGTLAAGDPMHTTPRPYDDGSYGFNVNGHGRDGDTSTESHGDPIGVACTACHDIGVPAGTHLDGTLNGRISPDTRNANSFHLVAGFMTTSPPAEEWTAQVTFDNYCYSACHAAASAVDMRHAIDTAGIHATPNVAEFGQAGSALAPMNTPPPEMFYDRNLMSLGIRDGVPNFALCVSCHNPHGTDVASPKGSLNNLMMIYRWAQPSKLCAKCH